MKFFKSNHRYNMYNQGFHYIAEFNTKKQADRELYSRLCEHMKEMYGPVKTEITVVKAQGLVFPKFTLNDNWRVDYREALKRRRIYLKDETAYTFAMLKLS